MENLMEEGLEIKNLQTAGVEIEIKDDQGHVWTIPAGGLEDYSDFAVPEPLGLPKDRLDKRFYYQFIQLEQLSAELSRGFVAVTRAELGFKELPDSIARDYGASQNTLYIVREMVLVKIPKQFRVYAEKQRQAAADAAVSGAGPTDAMLEHAKARGIKPKTPLDSRRELEGVTEDYSLRVNRVDEPLNK